MIAKYIRVSSIDQNTARQELSSKEAKQYTDKCSGSIPFAERPQASKLIKDIEQGKVTEVIVHSIDRLGRNQIDILQTIEYFKNTRTQLTVESLGISLFTSTMKESAAFGLITSIMATLAQMEREQIRERQLEGISVAKAKGTYKGRTIGTAETSSQLLSKHNDIVKCLQASMSVRETATITKKSKSTVQKISQLLRAI
ncbi:recombinase family protein [Empedobacter falsenii]